MGEDTVGREGLRVRDHARRVIQQMVAGPGGPRVDRVELAADLADDVLEKYLKYRPGADEPDPEQREKVLRRWTKKTAETTYIGWWRKEGKRRDEPLPQSIPPDQAAGQRESPIKVPRPLRERGPSQQVIDHDALARVWRELSAKNRELLILRHQHGLSSHDIARKLGYKDAHTVDVTLDRLRRRLRNDLGPDGLQEVLDQARFY